MYNEKCGQLYDANMLTPPALRTSILNKLSQPGILLFVEMNLNVGIKRPKGFEKVMAELVEILIQEFQSKRRIFKGVTGSVFY